MYTRTRLTATSTTFLYNRYVVHPCMSQIYHHGPVLVACDLHCTTGTSLLGRQVLKGEDGKTRSMMCNQRGMKGSACKHAIVFFIFYDHQMNIKIMSGSF